MQLDMGSDLLAHATHMLDNLKVPNGELRFLACRLVEALTDALRVAESRGARLPVVEHPEDPDPIEPGDGPDQVGDSEPPSPAA
ncbi:hypothetical protein [Streptomyces cavernicola]|uniref:hypothetical protein n=1 Tax=Streptomyces cavernicola TaxID=3043613 RepID=UPI0032B75B06